jgi:uncharacterized cupin superfamily protein
MNDTDDDVTLLVVGEPAKQHNKVFYPVNRELSQIRPDWWEDPPLHPQGPHDGLPKRRD